MAIQDRIINKKVIVRFSSESVEQPVIYRLVKDFDLIPNILRAEINPEKKGYILLGLSGYEQDYQHGMAYLEELGLSVQSIVEQVRWNEEQCTQCGGCTGVCPTGALSLERPAQTVRFDGEKCVVCNMCIKACPVQAVMLDF